MQLLSSYIAKHSGLHSFNNFESIFGHSTFLQKLARKLCMENMICEILRLFFYVKKEDFLFCIFSQENLDALSLQMLRNNR